MSVLTRTRRLPGTYAPSTGSGSIPAVATARAEVEAPERAASPSEAPEVRRGRPAEAPDAGEGRTHYCEHEFTHGRSQS